MVLRMLTLTQFTLISCNMDDDSQEIGKGWRKKGTFPMCDSHLMPLETFLG